MSLHPSDPAKQRELDVAVDLLNEAEENLKLLRLVNAGIDRINSQQSKIASIRDKIERMASLKKGSLDAQEKKANDRLLGSVRPDGSCNLDGVGDLFRRCGFQVEEISDTAYSVTATKDHCRVEVRLVDPKRYAYVTSNPESIARHAIGDRPVEDRRLQSYSNVKIMSDFVQFKKALNVEILGSRGETYATIFREAVPGMNIVEEVRKSIALMFVQRPEIKRVLTLDQSSPMLLK